VSETHPLILRKLEMMVEGREKTEAITVGNRMYPPCFESRRQYNAWLESADPDTGSQPPMRKDFPYEPNYCRDCNHEGRNQMRLAGRCLFPSTVFVTVGSGDDEEIVGTTK
jgi:hypothetical protein